MILGLFLLLLCQLAGEIGARATGLPVPGPVLGMVLLFILFMVRDRMRREPGETPPEGPQATCRMLLANMSLLFVPAGVGVVDRIGVLTQHGVALTAVLVLSTVITLTVTAFTFIFAARLFGSRPDDAARQGGNV